MGTKVDADTLKKLIAAGATMSEKANIDNLTACLGPVSNIPPAFKNEKEFQREFITLAQGFGWRVIHIHKARVKDERGHWRYITPVDGDGKGFPDNLLVRGEEIIVAELKMPGGRPAAEQEVWLEAFELTGVVDVYVWKPDDWPDILKVLA